MYSVYPYCCFRSCNMCRETTSVGDGKGGRGFPRGEFDSSHRSKADGELRHQHRVLYQTSTKPRSPLASIKGKAHGHRYENLFHFLRQRTEKYIIFLNYHTPFSISIQACNYGNTGILFQQLLSLWEHGRFLTLPTLGI